jgi:hypothetical protein
MMLAPSFIVQSGWSLHCSTFDVYRRKKMVVSVWSDMVSWFCVRFAFKRWFLKIIKMTMKNGPFDAIEEFM